MKSHRHLALASALAVSLVAAAGVAAARSDQPSQTTPGESGASVTGKLPDESLAGKRTGTMTGDPVTQGNGEEMRDSATADPEGNLPDGSLAEKRTGTMTGEPVTQGGGKEGDVQ
ncbi:hypothetical protein [Azospirillum sp. ST 5-10]|uniref:hypothetical protein n=1 Tax=unclassified Azospirillum TaxID=2630922 RepID=UPI003F4A5C0F